MEKTPIVLTGGHGATTALSVIEEIKSQNLPWEIHFIGTKQAVEGKKALTLESQIFSEGEITFHSVISGRLQRKFGFWTIPSLFKIPFSFIQALFLLVKIKPKVILSFGGAVSFPVVVVGKLLGISSILHEQTSAAGRANLAASKFVKGVALARLSSRKYFRGKKVYVTGNPILSFFTKVKPKLKLSQPPIIYITAGSRGSITINNLIEGILRKLLAEGKVIHQTGMLQEAKFRKIKDNLPVALSQNYEVFGQVNPKKLKEIYARIDMVISRAGANSVAEIIATRRPAILIPIPWSYLNEQYKNAVFAKKFGIATVLDQRTLTPVKLFKEINLIKKDWEQIVSKAAKKKSPDTLAAKLLVDILKKEIENSQ